MPYLPATRRLGIIPAVLATSVPQILSAIEGLFQGSSYDQTHQSILQYSQLALSNPQQALSGNYTPGNNPTASPANAYLWLNCLAGNEAVLATYRRISGDPAAAGCGCEVSHGCRADAQQALAAVNQALGVTQTGPLSMAPQPTGISTSSPGIQIGIPVSGSTIANSELFGVPVWLLAVGAVGGVIALSRTGRRRA